MTIVHKQRTIILAALFGSIVIGYGWFTVRQRQARLDAGLFSAVEDHNAARVQALVSAGAVPNAREPLVPSTSFLQWFRRAFAGLRGHPAIQQPILVRVLFQLEMDDRNPETIAEDERIAKLLLQAGASGNASDEDGFTPLTLAVFCKQADLVHPMLIQGADPNATTTSGIWPD